MEIERLRAALLADRLAAYRRLRGGFPVPLAGTVYWAVLGVLGYQLPIEMWCMVAFLATGAIFPLAMLFAAIFGNRFMKDRTAAGDVLIPAFIAMLLFWPMIVAAVQVAPQLVPLILAIGMSLHWPVIGWSYGRTGLFSAHSIVRAVVVLLIWLWVPEWRFTVLPFAVAAIYLATVFAILIDSGRARVPD
jgi:hypothetical protein